MENEKTRADYYNHLMGHEQATETASYATIDVCPFRIHTVMEPFYAREGSCATTTFMPCMKRGCPAFSTSPMVGEHCERLEHKIK